MRRHEKEITSREEIDDIINNAALCRLAMVDSEGPYVVPLNFGYEEGAIWLHSARSGRKIEALRADPRVCLEFDIDYRIVMASRPCGWTSKYRSAIVFGRASLVENPEGKRRGLDAIMRHYGGPTSDYDPATLDRTVLIRVEVESLSGKKSE